MTGLLLAAGYGSRLKPFTDHCPKPRIPFLDIPMAFYSLHLLKHAGISDVVVNTHHLPEQIERLFSDHEMGFSFHFSKEWPKILGSGGAIFHAKKFLKSDEPFFMANSDEILIPEKVSVLDDLMESHKANGPLATLLVSEHPEAGKTFGAVWVDPNGQVAGFGKTPPGEDLIPLHFLGYQAISQDVFEFSRPGESNIFYDIFADAIDQGYRILTHKIYGHWFETGNFDDYMEAQRKAIDLLLIENQFLSEVFKHFGFLLERDQNFVFGRNLVTGTDCQISGPVFIGENVRIGDHCTIKGPAVIGSNANIQDNTYIENATITQSATTTPHQQVTNTILF